MSVPFSNAHLRVPRGFGDLLEGLAREVLRDQPKDIPAFAALYFRRLLKEREDSGMDPAEWSARSQDRLCDYSFKTKLRSADASPGATKKEEAESLEKPDTEIIVPAEVVEEMPGIDTELSSVNDSDGTNALIPTSDGGTANVNICAKELKDPEGGVAAEDICAEELRQPWGEKANLDTGDEDMRDSDEGTADGSLPEVQAQAKEEAPASAAEPEGIPPEQVAEEQSPIVEAEGEPEEKVSEIADHSNQELSEEETKDVINPESENNQESMQKDFSPL